jgi:mono/diheme cytochrome c family protein
MIRCARVLCAGAAILCACAAEHRSAPAVGPFEPANAEQAHGEHVFFVFCHQCHPGGAAGLGPSLNDKPLPQFAMRTQIRAGVGAMPSFSDRELSDHDVSDVLTYIVALREHGK